MTEYRIDTMADGVEVEVSGIEGPGQADLLAAFAACQQGN